MATETSTSWKNRLQEYCQKNKLPYPNYRLMQESDTFNRKTFQAEVEIDGHRYVGEASCMSKKEAERSAAEQAYYNQCTDEIDSLEHMPKEYEHIEWFLTNRISASGGRIRKIRPPDRRGWYRIEIGGNYRYCENIKKHHQKNQVYFLVDPVKNVYYQRCYDLECYGFQSAKQSLPSKQSTIPFNVTNLSEPAS